MVPNELQRMQKEAVAVYVRGNILAFSQTD